MKAFLVIVSSSIVLGNLYWIFKQDNSKRDFAIILNKSESFRLDIREQKTHPKGVCVAFGNRFFLTDSINQKTQWILKKRSIDNFDCVVAILRSEGNDQSLVSPKNNKEILEITRGGCIDLANQREDDECIEVSHGN